MVISARDLLEEKGISPLYHRLKILEFLMNTHDHPTVDDIHRNLLEEIPTLSKTTVYNILKIFVESGLVEPFNIMHNEVRYEFNLTPHAHFQCKKCGEIFDLPDSSECLKDKVIDGHEIHEHQISLRGFCRKCREQEKEGNA